MCVFFIFFVFAFGSFSRRFRSSFRFFVSFMYVFVRLFILYVDDIICSDVLLMINICYVFV